jgi:hypothetical protein
VCDSSPDRGVQHVERVTVRRWRVLRIVVVLWFGVEADRCVEVDQPAPLPFRDLDVRQSHLPLDGRLGAAELCSELPVDADGGAPPQLGCVVVPRDRAAVVETPLT